MYYIGIDIGGTKCASSLGKIENEQIDIIKKDYFLTDNQDPFVILDRFSSFIEECIKNYKIEGIGISCGGPLDSKKGIIMAPPSLPLWDNIKVVEFFENRFNIPTRLLNDANSGALAEWKYGAGKGVDDVVFLTCGTGFGAGVISGGHLLTGANDNFGEIGHVRLTKKGPLGYNKEGSCEGYCSGSGIKNLAKILYEKEIKKGRKSDYIENIGIDNISAKLLAEGCRKDDWFSKKVYKTSGKMLGESLAIIIDLLNPSRIVIGGIFMRSGDLLIKEARKIIKKEALPLSRKVCKILPASLGESIGDISALVVATGNY